ncbi:MAG: DUF3592 domain-containing protein [Bauldia litoralis]
MSNEWGLVVLGVIFLGFAIGCWAMMEKDVRHWIKSTGTVVDMVERSSISSSSGSRTMHFAVVEFETPDGQRHRATSTYGLRQPPALGAVLPIRYDAADTSRATTAPNWFRWAFSYGFGVVGLVFLVGGVAQMVG